VSVSSGTSTIAVTDVSLNKTSTTITVGNTETLTATVAPSNATNKNVTWSSGNAAVATVNQSGHVTAASAGSAVITVTTQDGNKTATCSITVTGGTVAVTGVTLNKSSTNINAGGTEALTATVLPSNATNKNVTWSSNNTAVATVSASGLNGTVTAVSSGTARITVTTFDGGFTANCTVTVTVPVAGVTLNKTSLDLYVGDTETLIATVLPSNATNKAVEWTSSAPGIATVSANGVVTAVSAGSATITVKTEVGGYTDKCTVTVKQQLVTSYSESMGAERMAAGFGDGFTSTRNITSSFNISDLKIAGYSIVKITLTYDAKWVSSINLSNYLRATIMKRADNNSYTYREDKPSIYGNSYSLTWDLSLDSFDNFLAVSWYIPNNCTYQVDNRKITIQAL
jgi:uncharacterized protein YjdB